MLKSLLNTLFFLFCFFATSYACTHTLRITDTWGDGWNNGRVKVQVNGVDVLTNIGVTFTGGAGPLDFTFNANAGDVITVIETAPGGYPLEMQCQVLDGGMTAFSAPFDPSATGTSFNANCPPPMSITSATVVQASSAAVSNCGTAQAVVCLQVTTTGVTSPITLTQIQSAFTGTAVVSAISNSRIYYTGTVNAFSATTLFGSAAASGTTYSINGSQVLASGVNYFWLAYDLNNTGTIGATIDANLTQFTAGAINYTNASTPAIAVTNPAGSRSISLCLAPGGVYTGLETWLRADAGTTGVASMTAWQNQAAGTATTLNGNPALQTANASYNYNPYVDFTAPAATLSGGIAAARQCILLNGYSATNGVNYRSLFFALQLNDLTRSYTHLATVRGITHVGPPGNGSLHGGINGTSASILQNSDEVTDFGTSAAATTWQRNGTNLASTSIHSTTKHILSAVCQTAGSTTLNTFLGGQEDNTGSSFTGHVRDWRGPVGELIGYTATMSAAERQRIHSYLAIKYGMTLSTDYLATTGATIFTTAAPYNNNIIGIGRDDVEALNQKQSHYDNDNVRIYISALSAMNASNGGSFGSDLSYIVMGDNNGAHCATAASLAEMPASVGVNCALYSRLEKEWKVTRTSIAQNYNMDVRLAACGAPGSVNVAHLRLLVDDDGNFSNGGTTCYYNGDGTGIVFTYANPVITISNLGTTHIPNNQTRFITIASINIASPLPVELLEFDAQLNNERTVDLSWSTASEHNADRFEVQKLNAQQVWETIAGLDAQGESTTQLNYATKDVHPFLGINYYRLKMVDNDGIFDYSETRSVALNASAELLLFPNPAGNFIQLIQDKIAEKEILITDEAGRIIPIEKEIKSDDTVLINTQNLANGVYFIRMGADESTFVQKVVIQH